MLADDSIQARVIHDCLVSLGATPLLDPVYGDDASNLQRSFMTWSSQLTATVQAAIGDSPPPVETQDSSPAPDTSHKKGDRMKRLKGEKRKPKGSTQTDQQTPAELLPPEEIELEEEDVINDTFVYASSDEEEEEREPREGGGMGGGGGGGSGGFG